MGNPNQRYEKTIKPETDAQRLRKNFPISEFEPFDSAGYIEINNDGRPPELSSYIRLHEFLEYFIYVKILDLLRPTFPPTLRTLRFQQLKIEGINIDFVRAHIVKAIVSEVRIGSLHEIITFLVSIAIQPDIRAILGNLTANVVWEIMKYTLWSDRLGRYFTIETKGDSSEINRLMSVETNPIDKRVPSHYIEDKNLNHVLAVLPSIVRECNATKINFKITTPRNETFEMTLVRKSE